MKKWFVIITGIWIACMTLMTAEWAAAFDLDGMAVGSSRKAIMQQTAEGRYEGIEILSTGGRARIAIEIGTGDLTREVKVYLSTEGALPVIPTYQGNGYFIVCYEDTTVGSFSGTDELGTSKFLMVILGGVMTIEHERSFIDTTVQGYTAMGVLRKVS